MGMVVGGGVRATFRGKRDSLRAAICPIPGYLSLRICGAGPCEVTFIGVPLLFVVRLYGPILPCPMQEAVARLVDSTATELPPPMPGLPPTPEQLQQARRLAEAGTTELERVKEALEPRKPPAAAKPRAKDPMKAWLRAGRHQMGRAV
ncbi:hypothetical protein [Stenotrophomonas lactitubi]|nr:hypothetical protein [Stenotrophomonas lactitubi]